MFILIGGVHILHISLNSIFFISCIFLHILHIVHILHIFHVFILDLILFRILVAGFELSSDEDDVPLHPDLQAQTHDVLHDMPSPVLPPLPPAQRPFEFSSFIRRSGGDTTSLLSANKGRN